MVSRGTPIFAYLCVLSYATSFLSDLNHCTQQNLIASAGPEVCIHALNTYVLYGPIDIVHGQTTIYMYYCTTIKIAWVN